VASRVLRKGASAKQCYSETIVHSVDLQHKKYPRCVDECSAKFDSAVTRVCNP
jgi:hypothetical protein